MKLVEIYLSTEFKLNVDIIQKSRILERIYIIIYSKINKQASVTSYKHLFTTNLFRMSSRAYHTRQVTIALIVKRK